MTGKEALSSLKEEYYIENDEHIIIFDANDDRLKIIEKDLEVLDKIKRFIEEWAKAEFPSKSGDYYMGEILEVQEYDK